MDPILNVSTLEEIFQNDRQIGSYREYADRIRQLHHHYLESVLLFDAEQDPMDIEEMANFAEDAEFLATEYTNPLVVERHEGLPFEDVPTRKTVQDALALAGTIFEFLGDMVSIYESRLSVASQNHHSDEVNLVNFHNEAGYQLDNINELHYRVGRSQFLYLKSAICYGLGLYESRTQVILDRLLKNLREPDEALTPMNAKQWEEYILFALLSRNLYLTLHTIPKVRTQTATIQQELRYSIVDNDALSALKRWSPQRIATLNTSLALIEACTFYAEAFLRGELSTLEEAHRHLDTAIKSCRNLHDYQFEWIIRTSRKVITRMWIDSPWMRLGELIPKRKYLKKLIEDGIVTLWSSQIAALELKSKDGPLLGGYLNDQCKRVVIHMPTSAGKTLLAQLAIAHQLFSGHGSHQCVYVGPSRALCDQVASELGKRLGQFGIRVTSIVSDNDLIDDRYESLLFGMSKVIVITPEKLNYLLRQHSPFIYNADLFIFDELHNIGKSDRGWIYEETISLLLYHPQTCNTKMLFLSAVMPNHLTVQEWVDPERLNDTVSQDWQPTRILKGVVQFPLIRPRKQEREIILTGDLLYVRHKEDLTSPMRIKKFIQSKQVRKNISENGWKRDSKLSDNEISHAVAAAIRFVKLGPVMIYCPQREDAIKCIKQLISQDMLALPPLNEEDQQRYSEVEEFVKERLPSEHPLVSALQRRVAFHHGRLPRDIRNEIEFAFQKGWILILAATSTLVEGVNFPIKTLLLMDYCQRYWDSQRKAWKYIHPLSKSDFKNIAGRAGRALYETEGQVVFIQAINGYPYQPFDIGFKDYLVLESDSPELNITSSLANDDAFTALARLVEEVDNGRLTEEQLLMEAEERVKDVAKLINRLHIFTLLLQDQKLVGEEEESFVHIFQRTFLDKLRPNGSSQQLGAFTYRSAKAIQKTIVAEDQALFAQTGLKISTCLRLMERVQDYWKQRQTTIFDFLQMPLEEEILRGIAAIIYGLNDSEVAPLIIKGYTKLPLVIDHITFFVEWILYDDPEWYFRHFSPIKELSSRAQAYTDYIRDTLEYKASWVLSAFWLFSKAVIKTLYNVELINTPLGRELILLPAYAKFGVNSPAAALFSTLGLSPSQLTRELSKIYTEQYASLEDRYNYQQILQWILGCEPLDLEKHGLRPSYIRRITRLLASLRPSEVDTEETERLWEANFTIAGWQHYEGEDVLQTLYKGSRLQFRLEPRNRYDPNAVEILTSQGIKIGYVPRSLSQEIASQMAFRPIQAIVSRINPSATAREKIFVHCWAEE